jgi:hypothetical protein
MVLDKVDSSGSHQAARDNPNRGGKVGQGIPASDAGSATP